MRALLIVGTLVTATLIPWDSLSLPGAGPVSRGSHTQAESAPRARGPAARLSPSLGIVPLPDDFGDGVADNDRGLQQTASAVGDADTGFDAVPRRVAGPLAKRKSAGVPAAPPGVVCKDGVCTVPDRWVSDGSVAVASVPPTEPDDDAEIASPAIVQIEDSLRDLTWEQARARLQQLGATQFRMEMDSESGQYRFWCRLPVRGQTNVGRQFEAWAASDMEAVIKTLAQVEAYQRPRGTVR